MITLDCWIMVDSSLLHIRLLFFDLQRNEKFEIPNRAMHLNILLLFYKKRWIFYSSFTKFSIIFYYSDIMAYDQLIVLKYIMYGIKWQMQRKNHFGVCMCILCYAMNS